MATATTWNAWWACRRIARRRGRSARPAGLEARARGTLIHRLLETLDFARPDPLKREQVTKAASELGMRLSEGEREEIAALIDAARMAAPAARVAGGERPCGVSIRSRSRWRRSSH